MDNEEKSGEATYQSRERMRLLSEKVLRREAGKFLKDPTGEWSSRLKAARMAAGLNQVELAEALEVHVGLVARSESGRLKKIQRKFLEDCAAVLSCNFAWLASGQGDPPPGVPSDLQPPVRTVRTATKVRMVAGEVIVPGWLQILPNGQESRLPPRAYDPRIIEAFPQQVREGLVWAFQRKGEMCLNGEDGDVVLIATHSMLGVSGFRIFDKRNGDPTLIREVKVIAFRSDESDPESPIQRLLATRIPSDDGVPNWTTYDNTDYYGTIVHRMSYAVAMPIDTSTWPKEVRVTRRQLEISQQAQKTLQT